MLVAVLRNVRIPGLALVALGAASNLLAIAGQRRGHAGVARRRSRALEPETGPGFSNSVVMADPALRPLTDIFALPAWLPFANVFSIGDVLIGLGVAVVIALGMRAHARPGTERRPGRELAAVGERASQRSSSRIRRASSWRVRNVQTR